MDLDEREAAAVTKLYEVADTIAPSPEDIRRRAHGQRQRRSTGTFLATAACLLAVAAVAGVWTSRDAQVTVVAPSLGSAESTSDPTTTSPPTEGLAGSASLAEVLASLQPQITSDPVAVVPVDLPTDWEFDTVGGSDAYSIDVHFWNLTAPVDATLEIPTVYVCIAPRAESGVMHERCRAPDGEIAQRLQVDDPRVDAVLIGTPGELAPWEDIRFTTDLSEVSW